jgi:signal transduction histidine kinase
VTKCPYILRFLFAALLAIAPIAAWCGNAVTNMTDLLACLGFNGSAGVAFTLDATVIQGTWRQSKDFVAKTPDGYIKLVDKVRWPHSFIHAGDKVRARGRTVALTNDIANGFVNADCFAIDVVGHVAPEPPTDATIDDVLAGKYAWQPVRIRGTVRNVFSDEIDHLYQHIIVSANGRSIGLAVKNEEDSGIDLATLIGAEVRAIGCYSPFFSGFRRLSRSEINIRSMDYLEILQPPPKDPFSVPSIASIHVGDNEQLMNLGRHSARGVVIAVWQRRNFAIKTAAGDIVNVSLSGDSPPTCGDVVDVAGLPDTDLYRVNLRRAIWRRQTGAARLAPETAVPTAADALFTDGLGHNEIKPSFHGKAIALRGTVTGVPSAGSSDGIVRLQCDGFTTTIDVGATPEATQGLEIGSEAEISGTCIVKTDSWHLNEPLPRIRDVVLVVRAPSDVKVLAPPPWWTPGRLFALVAVLLTLLAAFLLWNVLLRRLAEKRGNELMRSRLSQEESKLKVQERTRIAVELHDTIAQNLTGVSLEIDSAEQLATKNPSGMMKHLAMAARTLQSCRNELRNCLWDLRSRALENTDLNEAIRRTIAPLVSDVELGIRFNVPRKALADDTAHVLMRIVRELATNAVRHGGATAVKIAGSLEDGLLRFSVRDNGCGFDPATCPGVSQGHFGLQGIRERVNQFNGEMEIESSPGKGARVSVYLTLNGQESIDNNR